MTKKHVTLDKVENGFWIRYSAPSERGEDIKTIVFETYDKMEKWLKSYLENE